MHRLLVSLLAAQLAIGMAAAVVADEPIKQQEGPKVPYHSLQQDKLNGERLKAFIAENEASKRANIMRMVAHVGDAAVDWIELGGVLRYGGVLDPILRELAIVRVGLLMDSDYEVFYHDHYLKELGVAEEKIRALREGATAAEFNDVEKAVLRLTDSVMENYKPGEDEFSFLLQELGMQAFHELIFNIGYYMMTGVYMETFAVEIEDPPLFATE